MVDFEELRKNFLPRFWDTLEKEMVYPIKDKGIIGYKPSTVHNIISIDVMFIDRFIMMKPTGLTDKNGNLLYEGDTIKSNNGHIYSILWVQEKLSFCAKRKGVQGVIDNPEFRFEVIGNIHENPGIMEMEVI